MRILPYILLAYITLGLQVGISRFIAIHSQALDDHGAAPNLGLLAALYIALNAKRNAALLGAFCIGFLQDLLTLQQPGMFAFSYGLFAMLVVALHHLVSREHPLTHFAMAIVGGLITAIVILIHGFIHPPRASVGTEFVRILYTAVLAPGLLWLLGKIRGAFAFQATYRR